MMHRFSWELHNGKIPAKMLVCHKCDNPSCVNPKHLFIGTQSDNIKDAIKKGRVIPPFLYKDNRGENNGNSKLTKKEVKCIRQLSKTMNQTSIAKEFNIDRSTVSYIINNKLWKNTSL